MKILRKYIIKEIIVMFLFSITIFTFTLVVGNIIRLAELVINKGVDIRLVGKLFLYLIPFLLSYTIPMSILTSALLVFGRLSGDNEIVAIKNQANGCKTKNPPHRIHATSFVVRSFFNRVIHV